MHLLYIHLFFTSISSSSSFLPLSKNEGIAIGNIKDELHVQAHTDTDTARNKSILWCKIAKISRVQSIEDAIINII